MARNTLGLKLEGSLTFPSFHRASGYFLALVKALAAEIAAGQQVTWPLADLQIGSALIAITAETTQPEVGERIVHAYASVGNALAFETPIPYSPSVNRHAMALSQMINGEVTALAFTTALGDVEVTRPVSTASQRKKVYSWGAIDGRLETLTSHRRLAFTLYEHHFGTPVTCTAHKDQEELMVKYWQKYVRVSGLIVRNGTNGLPLEIQQISDVRELYTSDPDSYTKAAGLLNLQGEAPEDLIRRLRDADVEA